MIDTACFLGFTGIIMPGAPQPSSSALAPDSHGTTPPKRKEAVSKDPDFQEIYQEFQPKIRRYLARVVGEHEAEDLIQEVFMRVARGLKDFRGESQLSTWIFKVAANVAKDRQRSPSYSRTVPKEPGSHHIQQPGGEPGILPVACLTDQQLIKKEMNECIRSFINELPDSYREILVLSDLSGLSTDEIAHALGITPGNVKTRLHRARAKLREVLEVNCSFYRDEQNVFSCDLKVDPEDSRD